MIAALFYHPVTLPVSVVPWLVIPLCATVAAVYKTIRVKHLRELPRQFAFLMVYVLVGLAALGGALYLIQEYWP
jgi:4-hydroxybenzoate polyprenyltransferase